MSAPAPRKRPPWCRGCGYPLSRKNPDCHWHESAREEAAEQRAFEKALARLVEAAGPLWHFSDGEGGLVKELIDEALDERYPPPVRVQRPSGPPRPTQNHRRIHRLIERDGPTCRYCTEPVSCSCDLTQTQAVADHVMPRSRGGSDEDENRVLSCSPCNNSKADLTPSEWIGRQA